MTQYNNSSLSRTSRASIPNDPASLRSGLLGQDRPHIFKLLASYDLPFGFTLGGFLRVQSGTPWQAQGNTPSEYAAGRYLEPAGSRRLPTWTNFDLLGAYTFAFGGGMSVRLEGRVQNLFNTQTVLSVNQLQYNDPYLDRPTRNVRRPGSAAERTSRTRSSARPPRGPRRGGSS